MNNINPHSYKKSIILEKIKWLLISVLLIISILINYYFYDINFFLRIFFLSVLIIAASSLALYTKKVRYLLSYLSISKKEMQKIIWPKYQDTFYTTFIVISIAITISLILWGLDSIIFRLITFIISLRF